ncbi:NAD(P)H-hydrate epimerase-like isoform X1 [Ruditapes philippinarum]|uniref:NAD(P)H-hydrate epimerase-like isoform X1 n=1 Tax=Ruditapes philippinarum TaxID=129788 RepID=UPI00295AA565|nr:NAD(P)H-hydrate epimerase-like isoform X1 [Ruditapes philippinarum]
MDRISVNRFSFRRKGSHKKDKQKDDGREDKIEEVEQHKIKYISQKEAQEIHQELITEYAFSIEQLMGLSGLSCAVAIANCYPVEQMTKDNHAVLVCCGPGHNGGDGLVCARHLKMFGYKPTIFYPKRPNNPSFDSLFKQCESLDMPVLSFFPSEPHLITDSYNFVVDALLGLGFKGPVRTEFESVMETLKKIEAPICSIDIPSGWDVETGDENGLKPDMLISLTAPKMCAKLFKGKHHYLGGRFVPKTLEQKYELNLPVYPTTNCVVEIKIENEDTNCKENNDGKCEN